MSRFSPLGSGSARIEIWLVDKELEEHTNIVIILCVMSFFIHQEVSRNPPMGTMSVCAQLMAIYPIESNRDTYGPKCWSEVNDAM